MNIFKTLKFRLIVSSAVVALFSLAAMAIFLDRTLERHAVEDLKTSLRSQARLIASELDGARFLKGDSIYLDALAKKLAINSDLRVSFISGTGKVLGDSELTYKEVMLMENHLNREEVAAAFERQESGVIRYSQTLHKDMLYLAERIKFGVKPDGVIRLALPLAGVERMLGALRRVIAGTFLFSLVLAVIFGFFVLRFISRPLEDIIYASKKFAAGSFSHRITVNSSGELKKLAQTLNGMAAGIEEKIRETELQHQHLKAVFESMVEALIITDVEGVVKAVNPAAGKVFSVNPESLVGKTLLENFLNKELAVVCAQAVSEKKPVSKELQTLVPAKNILRVSAAPVFEKNSVSGAIMLVYDITEIRRLENLRKEFVANVSHELKTPLTVIRGCAETLLDGALKDAVSGPEFARDIYSQAVRLDNLVTDLLKLSQIESGRIVLEKTQVNLRELVGNALRELGSDIKVMKLEAENNIPEDMLIAGDKNRLAQILSNLIGNAVRYNKEAGSVKISSVKEDGKTKVIVEDTGIGIASEHLLRIFERFYRVDKARSKELGGTGLGLSIVKHLVELHGGTVGVESTPGHGSKFWFTLPQ